MRLTVDDIQNQEFTKSKIGGFKVDEVAAFMDIIARDYSEFIEENKSLKAELNSIRQKAEDMSALIKSRSSADAEVESELMISEAKEKAKLIIETAYNELSDLQKEVRLLKTKKSAVSSHLRKYLQSQLDLLELLSKDSEEDLPPRKELVDEEDKTVEIKKKPRVPAQPEIKIQETEEEADPGLRKIGDFVQDVELGELPEDLEGDSSEDAEDHFDVTGVHEEIVVADETTELEQPRKEPGKANPKMKKVLEDLEKIANVPTGMFKKADFKEMLQNEKTDEHKNRIDEIYTDLANDEEKSSDKDDKEEDK